MDDIERQQVHAALESHFKRTRWPRSLLGLIITLTGYIGFLASHVLLRFGEVKMWIRYPIAVAIAYAAFLGLLRVWAEFERRHIDLQQANNLLLTKPLPDPPRSNSWLGWLDLDFLDIDFDAGCIEGCLVLLVIILIVGTVAFVLSTAPGLIADVFIDAVLMGMLYKHLRSAARRHWLSTAISRTWIAALITAVVLSYAGAKIQQQYPQAKSIGDVWRRN